MHWTLKLLLAPISLILLGVCLMIGGTVFTWQGYANRVPERSELAVIAGTVHGITRHSNRRLGEESFVRYELELSSLSSLVLTEERLAAMKLGQPELQALKGKTIEALVTPRTNYEIWEFTASGKKLQDYDVDGARYYRMLAANGPLASAAGLLLLVIGLIALRIKQFRGVRAQR
jgi:hypothetical protein